MSMFIKLTDIMLVTFKILKNYNYILTIKFDHQLYFCSDTLLQNIF